MALIQCPECAREISDAAASCPHCGYPVLQNTDQLPEDLKANAPNPETCMANSKQNGKKKIVAICAVLAIAIIGIIAGVSVHKFNLEKQAAQEAAQAAQEAALAAAQAAEEYQTNIDLVVYSMLLEASSAETCCGLIHDVWYNTIYEKSDINTNKFTKTSQGKFNSDFNTSLRNLFQDDDFTALVDEIEDHQSTVEYIMKELANPPEEYKEAYNAILRLYEAYLSLTGLAINPSGSLQTFTANYNEADSNFIKLYKTACIYTN